MLLLFVEKILNSQITIQSELNGPKFGPWKIWVQSLGDSTLFIAQF